MLLTDKMFRTLLSREVLRFMRVWTQTLIPPLLTSLLYVVVFGVALGARIKEIEGVPYLQYILPGIAMMSLITGSYMNTSTSVFDAKRERYIDDVLISPMSDLQIALATLLAARCAAPSSGLESSWSGRRSRGRAWPIRFCSP